MSCFPAKSTVHAVLDRHGLVKRAKQRRRQKAQGTALSQALIPNALWCTDFKGEFKLGNGQYCYPLTVTDQASRYLFAVEAFDSNRQDGVIEAFVQLFKQYGLPDAIRSDNGVPFASPNGLYNLSRLSGCPSGGHAPPNGWNCRCTLQSLSERDIEKLMKAGEQLRFDAPEIVYRDWLNKRTGERRHIPIGIDPGWDHNPGKLRASNL